MAAGKEAKERRDEYERSRVSQAAQDSRQERFGPRGAWTEEIMKERRCIHASLKLTRHQVKSDDPIRNCR